MNLRHFMTIYLISSISARTFLTPELVNKNIECNELNNRICLNGGICADFSILLGSYEVNPTCVCSRGFYGPSCEYVDERYFLSRESRMKRFKF